MLHLAAGLKKLLTIFLLVLMAGHTTGYSYYKKYELDFVQEADEKKENTENKTEKKEYILSAVPPSSEPAADQVFPLYLFAERLSPILNRPAPPPDVTGF